MKNLSILLLIIIALFSNFSVVLRSYKLEVIKDKKLSKCFNDSLLNNYKLIGRDNKNSNLETVYIYVKSYYFDSSKCAGVCLYYVRKIYKNNTHLAPHFLYGTPYKVLIFTDDRIVYLSDDIQNNRKELEHLKSVLTEMPDSIVSDPNLLNNYVLQ
jgi:hypothetical protein